MKSYKSLFNLAILYLGKIGGIFVTLLFIPVYKKFLTPEQFGLVGILISLQVIVYVLDFGFSVHLSRLASKVLAKPVRLSFFNLQYRSSLFFLKAAYVLFFIVGLIFIFRMDSYFVPFSVLLILGLTTFNLRTALLLASQRYVESSVYQLGSSLARGGVSALAVYYWNQNLNAFVLSQVAVMLLANLFISRSVQRLIFNNVAARTSQSQLIKSSLILFRRCLPLLITAGVGAVCTQADRFVILTFISTEDVGNYFLAITYALTPIVLVAQPLFQYFYPKLVESYGTARAEQRYHYFLALLSLAVLTSSVVLFMLAEEIIGLWLGNSVFKLIWPFVSILLVSSIFAALSFAPYAIMLCEGKYNDLKKVTVVTVIAYSIFLSVAAYFKNLSYICYALLGYNLVTIVAQAYYCNTYQKGKRLAGKFFTFISYALPFILILLWVTIDSNAYLVHRISMNTILVFFYIYAVGRIGYSLKGKLWLVSK